MSRRRLLGAVFAAPAAVALPVSAAPSPDAALLADCARWQHLTDTVQDAWWASNNHTEAERNRIETVDEEAFEVFDSISEARPATLAGVAAKARVMLREAVDFGEDVDDGHAFSLLLQLAEGDAAFDARLSFVRAKRQRLQVEATEARAAAARRADEQAEAEERCKEAERTRSRTAEELRDKEGSHHDYLTFLRGLLARGEAEAAEISLRLALAVSTGRPA